MSSSSGPRAKCDQVVFEAIAKAAEIIVYARSPPPPAYNSPTSARFNLQIPEVAEIRQSLQHHRQSLHLPLRLEVYSAKSHQLLERWTLEYHTMLQHQQQQSSYGGNGNVNGNGNGHNGDPIVQLRHVCKKVVIWLRTLYCWTRMLPSFGIRGPDLLYRLEVVSDMTANMTDLPQFSHRISPPVPTPYGRLVWKVWYAPHVQKPTTKPMAIPIATTQAVRAPASSTPIAMYAKSAPTRENFMLQQQSRSHNSRSNHIQHKPSSFDRSGLLKKTHSNVEDHSDGHAYERPRFTERSNSGNLSHRAALHDPPTYAYNAAPPTATTTTPHNMHPLSSSPNMLSATPPPAFLSSTPPTLGFLLPPANTINRGSSYHNNNTTPPFSALPRELSQPEELCSLTNKNDQVLHSLDLLHASPFKTNASVFSSLGESEHWMLRSSMIGAAANASFLQEGQDDEEDMPFAVDVDFENNANSSSSSMAQLAQAKTAQRLQFLSVEEETQEADSSLSALSQQLQDFKTFGASLEA